MISALPLLIHCPGKQKIHFLVEFDGTKSLLTINNNGDFEFAREGRGKLYNQEIQTGTIDTTPVGQAGIARAEQIGTTLTGHDMKAIQWLNFPGSRFRPPSGTCQSRD